MKSTQEGQKRKCVQWREGERERLGGCMSEESVRGELSSLDGTLQKQSGERVVYDGRENKSVKMSLTAR